MVEEAIAKTIPYMGQMQLPVHEPVLAQKDERQFKHIMDLLMEYKEIEFPGSDGVFQTVKVPDKPKFEDIYVLLASIGTLEGTTNYNLQLANAKWFDWEEYLFFPIRDQYEHDHQAMIILNQIRDIAWRKCYGDSLGGSRQSFVVQLGGSKRALELITNQKEKKGLFGWLK